jgi:hypothetical protein
MNRTKGHNLERQVSKDLRTAFPFAKTSRASSKLLDDTGVDLNFVPFSIQCKSGYNNNRPKYEKLYKEFLERKDANFPQTHVIHTVPYILIHKLNCEECRGKNNDGYFHNQVTMTYDYFLWLINNLDKEVLKSLPLLS